MRKVAAGSLTTANAVAAVGGLDAARDGMQGLMDGRFPGKMVIFPQVESFPLTALARSEGRGAIGVQAARTCGRLDARLRRSFCGCMPARSTADPNIPPGCFAVIARRAAARRSNPILRGRLLRGCDPSQ